MKVFRACLTIMKRRAAAFLVYFIIFTALAVVMTTFSVKQYSTDFSEIKPNFTVINRDRKTPLTDGLLAYLREHGTEVKLEYSRDALQDATFYHASDYILILPEGFSDAFGTASPVLMDTVTTPDSARGYYMDSLVNQYLNICKTYKAAKPGLDEAVWIPSVLKDLSLEASVEKKIFGNSQPVPETYQIYNRMGAYIIIILITLCVSMILMVFRRTDLRMRNLCAPLKSYSLSGQLILYSGVVSIMSWVLLTVTGFVLYYEKLVGTDARAVALILLNSLVFMVVSLGVAMIAGCFIRTSSMQNAVANFLSLGLCFLGGIFVPLDMLGEGLLSVARFMPTYWYVTALDSICGLTSFTSETMAPIWQSMLIQLGFAAALLCVSLVVNKNRNRAENSFGDIKTEMEA